MAKQVKIDIVARDKTKRAIASSKKGLGGLKTFALAASAALASIGAGRALTGLVNVGKEMENLQVRFKFLFGSVEEGKIAFDNLSKFASKVPFALDEIAMASGNLAVVAKDAKDLTRILEITGNVAAFTGLDFQTTASQIQRAFSGGIAAADIFREKGLRQVLGFSEGAKVSIEETQQKFEEIFGKNGRLGNVTDDLADTLTGTLSMIQDKFLKFKMAVNEAFFAELKKQFGDLDTFLAENEESILKFGKNIGEGLAFSLKESLETIEMIVAGLALMSRATELLDDKTGGYASTLLELTTAQGRMNVLMGLFTDNQQNVTELFNSLLQPAEVYQDQILRIADGYGVLTSSIQEEAIPALEKINDVMGTLGKGDDFFSQRASASRDAVKAIELEAEAEEKKKKAQKGLFDQAKKFSQEGMQRSKKLFKLNQALAIGEAIFNTYQGATKALAQGGIFGIATAGLIVATGLAQVANIRAQQPPAMFGGSRQQGTPFLVGERGPELFTPATAGTVTPNHQLTGGGHTVNFNITTVDAQSFGALLDTRRGQIVNMINTALNNKGQAALV